MAGTAEKTDPALWERVKAKVTKSDKGGRPGQWSARKAQLSTNEYKKAGGGYRGPKPATADNHLKQWAAEDWGTKSGEKSTKTGERYLPKRAREKLSDGEYQRTTAKKRRDTAAGKQHSPQPADVARKTAGERDTGRAAPRRAPARKAATRTTAPREPANRQPAARKPTPRKPAARAKTPARPAGARAATKPAARKTPARQPASRRVAPPEPAARKAPARAASRAASPRKPAPKRAAAARQPAAAKRSATAKRPPAKGAKR